MDTTGPGDWPDGDDRRGPTEEVTQVPPEDEELSEQWERMPAEEVDLRAEE